MHVADHSNNDRHAWYTHTHMDTHIHQTDIYVYSRRVVVCIVRMAMWWFFSPAVYASAHMCSPHTHSHSHARGHLLLMMVWCGGVSARGLLASRAARH